MAGGREKPGMGVGWSGGLPFKTLKPVEGAGGVRDYEGWGEVAEKRVGDGLE